MMDRALAGPLYPAVPCEPEMLTRPLRDYCQIIIAIAIDTFIIYGCHLLLGGSRRRSAGVATDCMVPETTSRNQGSELR